MNINKYIDWQKLWDEEVDVKLSLDCLKEEVINTKTIDVLEMFQNDSGIEILTSECSIENDKAIFCFSESGGQNESDNQGWCRDYIITVDSDFNIIDAIYEQG